MIKTKSYVISKFVVLEAYKRVKANKGSSGVDNESMDDFEINLKDNLYKLWNRMSSGSYVPPPVKMVEIDKKDGGKRPLGIPTITDRIAQMVVLSRWAIRKYTKLKRSQSSCGIQNGANRKRISSSILSLANWP
jgi:retron-type reverse transcriptase